MTSAATSSKPLAVFDFGDPSTTGLPSLTEAGMAASDGIRAATFTPSVFSISLSSSRARALARLRTRLIFDDGKLEQSQRVQCQLGVLHREQVHVDHDQHEIRPLQEREQHLVERRGRCR